MNFKMGYASETKVLHVFYFEELFDFQDLKELQLFLYL